MMLLPPIHGEIMPPKENCTTKISLMGLLRKIPLMGLITRWCQLRFSLGGPITRRCQWIIEDFHLYYAYGPLLKYQHISILNSYLPSIEGAPISWGVNFFILHFYMFKKFTPQGFWSLFVAHNSAKTLPKFKKKIVDWNYLYYFSLGHYIFIVFSLGQYDFFISFLIIMLGTLGTHLPHNGL